MGVFARQGETVTKREDGKITKGEISSVMATSRGGRNHTGAGKTWEKSF